MSGRKALDGEYAFCHCNGLDADGHVTTARDIALMSRDLIHTYPQIFDYCNIWMEDITHTTKKGFYTVWTYKYEQNDQQYEYATGLKTGSTSPGKVLYFCNSQKKMKLRIMIAVWPADDSKSKNAGTPLLC